MSFMVLGSMMEADRRLREHEVLVRNQKKVLRDAEVWRRYEEDYSRSSPSSAGSSATSTAAGLASSSRRGGGESGGGDNRIPRED
jgi:uncharacterized membrane protein YgcG